MPGDRPEPDVDSISSGDRARSSELTHGQYLLWTGQRLQPHSPLYNMVLAFEIGGALDPVHFGRAWQALVERSDALRTIIEEIGGEPRQLVRRSLVSTVQFVDLSAAPDARNRADAWIAARAAQPFDLGDRLVDTALIRLAPDRHIWYLNQHHLVTDGWATALVYRRMAELYRCSLDGRLHDAPPLPQYAAWAEYERAFRGSPLLRRIREHWQQKLAELPEPVRLYGKQTPPAGDRTVRVTRELGFERSRGLRELAASTGAASLTGHSALFNLFATALLAYLHRVSGQRRLGILTPSHNRSSAVFKETIGLFIEVFPFIVEVTEDESLGSLLAKVQTETGMFLRYAQPGASSPEASRGCNVLLNYIHASFPDFDGLPMRSDWVHAGHGDRRHHLRLQVHDFDAAGRFVLHFDFNRDLFGAAERESAAGQFVRVLDALLQDRRDRLGEIALLDEAEAWGVLREFSGVPAASDDGVEHFGIHGTAPPPSPLPESPSTTPGAGLSRGLSGARDGERAVICAGTVVEMFEAQAARTPAAVALEYRGRRLSYAELERFTGSLARELRRRGVGAEVRAGVYFGRSLDAVVAILATLRAGGAYVPLSPADPAGRIAFMLRDAQADVVLTSSALREGLTGYPGRILCIGEEGEVDQADQVEALDGLSGEPLAEPGRSDAAYVLYTSGSSGQPKGVVVEHDAVARYLAWARDFYLQGEALDFPLFTSLSFDLTVTSLFLPLICGGRVVVYTEEDGGGPTLLRVLEEDRVDVIKCTPSHLALLHGLKLRPTRLRKLILGGEELRTEQGRSGLETLGATEIYNEYGPTEATVGCMIHRYDPEGDTGVAVPIGRPAADARVYVLDDGLNPVPPGVIGEIFVSGPGLARGYLNRPELTRKRFLPDPFAPGARMYRTGDRGRWRADGLMQYLGRIDQQVKIRGARIEPGEVEAALLEHPAIGACVVDVIRFVRRGASDQEVYCARCGLPSSYPGAHYDAEGVCHLCRGFEGYREKVRGYFRSIDDLRELFNAARARRAGAHDCVLLLSGGKDSTYALYRLVQMGLRVLAFTLDNGYISEQAKANIRRVTEALGVEHVFGTTPAMNAIFVDSLKRHANVCNGCFKTLYTLATRLARQRGIPIVVTGLSRGQFFETRLTEELFRSDGLDGDRIDRIVLEARKAYHRVDDAVARLLDTGDFQDDALFEQVWFVDFYRYCDVGLDEMLAFLAEHAPWIRPQDTGRSTNCLINEVGIFVHKRQRGYHNYAFPYSWDVRIGHKSREAAVDELNDQPNLHTVRRILTEIGYGQALSDEGASEARLAAYYVSPTPIATSELRAHLAERLPAYMLPSHFVHLERLPLTPHGKVDRASLPSPEARAPELAAAYVAPRGPVEERVAAIWAEVLKLARVGARDEFLELGGNSLLAIQIISRVNHSFGIDLPLASAFEASTVAALARLVEEALLREIEALSEDEVQRQAALAPAAPEPLPTRPRE